MADKRVTRGDIFEKGLFDEVKKGASELNSVLEEQIGIFKKNLEVQKKLIKENPFKDSNDLKNFNQSIKEVDASYKAINTTEKARKAIKSDVQKATERLTKSQSKEAKVVASLNEKIKAQNKANREGAELNSKLTSEYRKQSITLNNLRKKYKDVALTTGVNSKESRVLSKEIKTLDKRLKDVDAKAGQFQRNVGNYPRLFTKIGAAFGFAALGLASIGRGIRDAIKTTNEYEKSNSRLQAVLGVTRGEMSSLRVQSQELGATTAFTASQVSELQVELAKLGFPIGDIKNMTESTLNAAAAMGSGLADTAKLTGATLKAFGLESTEAARVNDVLSAATSSSALDFDKLSNSMSTIAPVASSFGFSVEGTTALLGELSNAGFDASTAATATRNILLNLADSNGKLAKSLKEPVKDLPSLVKGLKQLESEGINLGEAFELTDKRSVAAFTTFLKGTDSVLELNDALEKAGGAAERMANVQLDNLSGDLKIAESAMEGFVLSLLSGDSMFSQFARSLVQGATSLLNFITVQERESDMLIKQNAELNALVKATMNANNTTESRERLIERLNAEYPDFLANLDTEKVTNEQLAEALKLANNEFERKILLKIQEEQFTEFLREQVDLRREETDLLIKFQKAQSAVENQSNQERQNARQGLTQSERALTNYTQALELNRRRQKEVNFELERLRGFYGEAKEGQEGFTKAVVDGSKEAEKPLVGLINNLNKKISDLKKARLEATSVVDIALIDVAIVAAEKELEKLSELSNKIQNAKKEFDEDVSKHIAEQGKKVDEEYNKLLAKRQKEIEENQRAIELYNNTIQKTINATNLLFEAQNRASSADIDNTNRKIQANQNALQLAERLGTDEIAFRQKQAAELEAQRERQAERQVRRQKIQSFFNLFAEFAKTEPNTAAAKALAQTAIANTLIGFFKDGTESVGGDTNVKWRSTGTDDYLAAVNKGERIVPTHLNAKIGDISNNALADLVYNARNGSSNTSVVVSPMNDDRIVKGLEDVKRSISSIKIDVDWNSQGEVVERTVRSGMNKTVRYVNSKPRL